MIGRPAFVTGRSIGRLDDVRTGLTWLLQATEGEPVIVAPTKSQYSSGDLADALGAHADALARGNVLRTPNGLTLRGATQQTFRRQLGWRGGPVLLLWPDSKALADVDDDLRVSAICVVPWIWDEVQTWATGRAAVDLSNPSAAIPTATISDPVVAEALKSLTTRVNLSTGLIHPSDKSAAVNVFRILRKNRYAWDPSEIEAWAIANGWSGDGARQLREVAAGVLAGRRYQVSTGGWRDDILELWRERAGPP